MLLLLNVILNYILIPQKINKVPTLFIPVANKLYVVLVINRDNVFLGFSNYMWVKYAFLVE